MSTDSVPDKYFFPPAGGKKQTCRIRSEMMVYFIFFVFSCIHVNENLYNVKRQKKKTDFHHVAIVFSAPEGKHIVFGDLSVRYNSGYKRETAVEYLQKKAAEYGADGIILNPVRRQEDKWSVSNSSKDQQPVNMSVDSYTLSGVMYQYLE
ncbi:MAG: hypothetical protein OEV66_05285 [Spirochaetia bacterium]|nr:hypothetical protein [Spirochaetia bacterium]